MIIVSDTSAISSLLIIDKLQLLPQIFGQIIIPLSVQKELLALNKFGFDTTPIVQSDWIKIQDPLNQELVSQLELELDKGESSAIALAIELNAHNLIIDETKGRKIAHELGIEVIGLIGILLEAKEKQLIQKIKPILDELRIKANFRISESLYDKILQKTNEIDSN